MNPDIVRKKRELFRISIRRQQQEEVFQKKRLHQNAEDWISLSENLCNLAQKFQIISENQRSMEALAQNLKQLLVKGIQNNQQIQTFLISFFQHLLYMFPNESDLLLNENFIAVIELTQSFLISQFIDQNEYSQKINEVQNQMITQLSMFLASLLYQIDIHSLNQVYKEIVEQQIELFHYINDLYQIECFCKFIANIIIDKSDFYTKIIEKSSFQQILLSKFDKLIVGQHYQVLNQIYLYFAELTENTDRHGTVLFKESSQLISIFDEQNLKVDIFLQECVQNYFVFITNITNDIQKNSPRTYQLFNLMTDYQLIFKVSDYLITSQNLKSKTTQLGYRFLLNLSMIDSSFSMEQLINQQVLNLIIVQINQENQPQYLIYPLLANLLTTSKKSTKQKIFDSGILGKISNEFEKKLQQGQYKDLLYIIQCIINSFWEVSQEQCILLIKLLLHCLFEYIIELDLQLLDLETCNEIYQCLIGLYQQNKEIKFSDQFVQKSQIIYEMLEDDSNLVENINYLLNIIELQYQQK